MVSVSDCGSSVRIPSVMWNFSALTGSYPAMGVLWAQWEGWDQTAELHECVFEQVPQIAGLVDTGITMTVNVVCGPG